MTRQQFLNIACEIAVETGTTLVHNAAMLERGASASQLVRFKAELAARGKIRPAPGSRTHLIFGFANRYAALTTVLQGQ